MDYQGIQRRMDGTIIAPCTACGYSGEGVKETSCGWCESDIPKACVDCDEDFDLMLALEDLQSLEMGA